MISRRPYVPITAVSLSLLTALILIAPVRASGDGGNPYGPGATTTKITFGLGWVAAHARWLADPHPAAQQGA
jgi:hypothetical protein